MTALMPRLWGDISDWFETDFPMHPAHLIRVEDETDEKEYKLRAELPGLNPEQDIQVSEENGVMTISAERRQAERHGARSEFRYGVLRRSVRLPGNADRDHITARYDQGVLEVTVPLSSPEEAGRKIPVTGQGGD